MEKLEAKNILVKGAILTPELGEREKDMNIYLQRTIQKQEDVIKLKEVSHDRLKTVVQL